MTTAVTGPSAAAPADPLQPAPKPPLSGPMAGATGAGLSEADRQAGFDAELAALDSGQRKSWRGAAAFGFVTPEAESAGCRAYLETVYVGGRPRQGHGRACRQTDGAWSIRDG